MDFFQCLRFRSTRQARRNAVISTKNNARRVKPTGRKIKCQPVPLSGVECNSKSVGTQLPLFADIVIRTNDVDPLRSNFILHIELNRADMCDDNQFDIIEWRSLLMAR